MKLGRHADQVLICECSGFEAASIDTASTPDTGLGISYQGIIFLDRLSRADGDTAPALAA